MLVMSAKSIVLKVVTHLLTSLIFLAGPAKSPKRKDNVGVAHTLPTDLLLAPRVDTAANVLVGAVRDSSSACVGV